MLGVAKVHGPVKSGAENQRPGHEVVDRAGLPHPEDVRSVLLTHKRFCVPSTST